jgi:hypothetical protein
MDWQPIAALGAVAVALLYVARAAVRTLRGRGAGCGGGCKCPGQRPSARNGRGENLIAADQLTLRQRGDISPGHRREDEVR